MRMLALIVADAAPERLRTALVLATATAAHGGAVRIFFQGDAVGLLKSPLSDPDAARQGAAGLPTLAELFDEAAALGASFEACQSSLVLLGLDARECDARVLWSGMVSFTGALPPDARLVIA